LFCFCWQLLICENTLIQVVKLKKKQRKKTFNVILEVNFNTYFVLRDKLAISMKMLAFFLAKCVRNAVKTTVVDRKNQKALALLYLASKPRRKGTNSSGVPTEFEQNRRGKFEIFA